MNLRLRQLRERRGLTIQGLAERAGLAMTTVWRIEAGRVEPRLSVLAKLAKALGVRARDLLGEGD